MFFEDIQHSHHDRSKRQKNKKNKSAKKLQSSKYNNRHKSGIIECHVLNHNGELVVINILKYFSDLQVESSENYNSVARARLRMQVITGKFVTILNNHGTVV